MRIREATGADAAALVELWRAAGLTFRAEHVPAELAAVTAFYDRYGYPADELIFMEKWLAH